MKTNKEVINWVEENKKPFIEMSDMIWELAELPWREFKSSKLQADFLEKEGFQITWDIGNINTAFVAEWGDGKPVLGFAGEYDSSVRGGIFQLCLDLSRDGACPLMRQSRMPRTWNGGPLDTVLRARGTASPDRS